MSQFVEQVQMLMHVQQIKYVDNILGKDKNYNWLINKRSPIIWMATKDELKIRRCLTKLNENQQLKVMKQLLKWLEEHPYVGAPKVPEICINLLIKMDTSNMVENVTLSRMNSFRNSLRRFSTFRNKVAPVNLNIPSNQNVPRRSVTFSDVLQIYSINN